MAFILKDGTKVALALELFDAEGNAASGEGAPVWSSSDETLITVDADGVASTVPGPGLGTATVTATVDADLGAGVTPVTGVLDIEVVAGDAAVVNITAGTPEPR